VVYLGVLFNEQQKSSTSKIISWVVLVVGGRELYSLISLSTANGSDHYLGDVVLLPEDEQV